MQSKIEIVQSCTKVCCTLCDEHIYAIEWHSKSCHGVREPILPVCALIRIAVVRRHSVWISMSDIYEKTIVQDIYGPKQHLNPPYAFTDTFSLPWFDIYSDSVWNANANDERCDIYEWSINPMSMLSIDIQSTDMQWRMSISMRLEFKISISMTLTCSG